MKRMKLPREGLVDPEQKRGPGFIDGDDVEGHGLPTTAPPSLRPNRGPGHGGEITPRRDADDDDVEGHRIK